MRRPLNAAAALIALLLVLALAAPAPVRAQVGDVLVADMVGVDGASLGTVTFTRVFGDRVRVDANLSGIPREEHLGETFHGFHVHAGAECDPAAPNGPFTTAGGHLGHDPANPSATPHGGHSGDMPSLAVRRTRHGTQSFVTDRFTLDAIVGRTVIVHAGRDNFAHIPSRYVSTGLNVPPGYTGGPDNDTLATGDAGGRVACGVIRAGTAAPRPRMHETQRLRARLVDVDGQPAGVVTFANPAWTTTAFFSVPVRVNAAVRGVSPGFHGFHVHSGDVCDRAAPQGPFTSAGGHFGHTDPAQTPHGRHVGDMPPLYAAAERTARLTYLRGLQFSQEIIGRPVIVHGSPDNFANIPQRYVGPEGPGPDAATRSTGDAGARVACGILRQAPAVERLAGAGRIQTAIAIARDLYPETATARAVVLARADRFPDALAGAPLAAAKGGPILLTHSNRLAEDVIGELQRVVAPGATVYLLGGTAALNADVQRQVRGLGYTPRRVGGATRVETAIAVARELGDPATLLVTTGYHFPDALAAGAAAVHVGGAVLLTKGEHRHRALDAYLAQHPTARKYAVGGPAARPYPEATPLVGATREHTALAVARTFFAQPVLAGLARRGGVGDDTDGAFADALTGSPHAGRLGGPVLLTATDALHSAVTDYLCGNTDFIDTGYVYGGRAAITDTTMGTFATASGEAVQTAQHPCG